MSRRTLTLRLDEDTYQALRLEAFQREQPISRVIREAIAARTQGGRPLALMSNPPTPPDEELHTMFGASGGDDWTTRGLRAIWRAGCDAGMVADRKSPDYQSGEKP